MLTLFHDDNEFCPDLAVLPAEAEEENSGAYQPDLIEFVAEVVSPSSIRRAYEVKPAGAPPAASPTIWSSTRSGATSSPCGTRARTATETATPFPRALAPRSTPRSAS
ncbi:hypothetical protein WJ438_17690 [Streptomyces sp. GD-15H]|uniref:hypothetical protein n=1 Tax=Streptomyces sp. GD-15H TaxID=3129112 RepID=UPI0032560CD9